MNNTPEIWLNIEEVCELSNSKKETIRRKCKSGEYKARFKIDGRKKNYEILLSSLPIKYIQKYNSYLQPVAVEDKSLEDYSNAPKWMRAKAEKYLELFDLTKNMTYQEKVDFLADWSVKYPEKHTTYPSLSLALRKYNQGGIAALLSNYGVHRRGISKLDENCFEYFKSIYLREGAPSAETSWNITLGFAKQQGINLENFPTSKTFIRRLRAEVPKQAIFMARHGDASWNKKYANYVPRDYSELNAGVCWVSDHAQIDVAVSFNGTVCFPWVTVFRDAKTSKWLGWFLHADSPNSDHIFQAFYYGVLNFGIPEDVYLDNGKDYRCKDFAGGRTTIIEIDTGLIDNEYMNSRFEKYLKDLEQKNITEEELQLVLEELHKSFAVLTQEEQKYANVFLQDVQCGNIQVEKNKTFRDYVTEYMLNAKNDKISQISKAFGLDEIQLRQLIDKNVNESNINQNGYFDALKKSVNTKLAKEYFEKLENTKLKPFQVSVKTDAFLRKFILEKNFEI